MHEKLRALRRQVQAKYTGPDIYYRPDSTSPAFRSSFFGRVDVIPFPFVAVLHFDRQPHEPLFLASIDDLSRLVAQNESKEVQARRRVRRAVRALEGQLVAAPRTEEQVIGKSGGTEVRTTVMFRHALLRIARNSTAEWQGYNYSSGFDVTLEYSDGIGQDGRGNMRLNLRHVALASDFGLTDDFDLTPALARLFVDNQALLNARLPLVMDALDYRRLHYLQEADQKRHVLSYGFLLHVGGDSSINLPSLSEQLRAQETSEPVQTLASRYGASLRLLDERFSSVRSSAIRAWWYLLWDDVWRRNVNVPAIKKQAPFFSPWYRNSICVSIAE